MSTASKIVGVNRFYAPDHSATAQLLTDLAEHLAAHHQLVTVITSRLEYDDPNATLPPREMINGVTIRRVWTTRFGRAGLWGRALDYASFYLSAFIALLAETKPGDTILAKTDPPLVSVPAAIAARLKRARLVNWCQDVFPEIAASLGMRWAGGPIGKPVRSLRNWSLRQAQCNVVLCEEMRQHLMAESVSETRIRVTHNWPDPAIQPLPRKREPSEPFTICYSGNLGRAHNVEAIIDLIEQTRDVPNLHWRFVGGGAGTGRLRSHVDAQKITNITFEGYAPRSQLDESLGNCEAHLVTLSPTCESLIHPSKIYGIMAAGRPAIFLGARDGSVAVMLASHQAGITLDATRPATWRPAIDALIADPERLATTARSAREAHQRHYTRDLALASWREVLTPAEAAKPATAEPKRAAA